MVDRPARSHFQEHGVATIGSVGCFVFIVDNDLSGTHCYLYLHTEEIQEEITLDNNE